MPVANLDAATDAATPSFDAGTPGSSCPAGRYSGEFTCTAGAGGFMPIVATTQVTLDLRQLSSPRMLTITDSRLVLDLNGWTFSGNISGGLDCTTDVLRADIVDGLITADFLPSAPAFTGVLDGQLDRIAQRISGAWSISTPAGSICAGTWHASLTP